MIYKLDLTAPPPVTSMPVSGAVIPAPDVIDFVPWTPSAWPEAPADDHELLLVMKRIFELSMLLEISGVIAMLPGREDFVEANGTLSLGVLNFFTALKDATEDFLEKSAHDQSIISRIRDRYTRLRRRARPFTQGPSAQPPLRPV